MPMKETSERKEKTLRILPADESVFLEGPKNRGYELIFSIKVWWQFIKVIPHTAFCWPMHNRIWFSKI